MLTPADEASSSPKLLSPRLRRTRPFALARSLSSGVCHLPVGKKPPPPLASEFAADAPTFTFALCWQNTPTRPSKRPVFDGSHSRLGSGVVGAAARAAGDNLARRMRRGVLAHAFTGIGILRPRAEAVVVEAVKVLRCSCTPRPLQPPIRAGGPPNSGRRALRRPPPLMTGQRPPAAGTG